MLMRDNQPQSAPTETSRSEVINKPGSQEKVRERRATDTGDESRADEELRNRRRECNGSDMMRFEEGCDA